MSDFSNPGSEAQAIGARSDLLAAISKNWARIPGRELSSLMTNDDLIHQVVAEYAVERAVAQQDVERFMAGRSLDTGQPVRRTRNRR